MTTPREAHERKAMNKLSKALNKTSRGLVRQAEDDAAEAITELQKAQDYERIEYGCNCEDEEE